MKTAKTKSIPLQVRVRVDAREKLKLIAEKNGLSLNDIATMCLAAGLARVTANLDDIHSPAEKKAA